MTQSLQSLTFPPVHGQAKQMVMMLHGYGADGKDLIELAHYWASSFPDCVFVAPNAPFPCEANPTGYQWFSLVNLSPSYLLRCAQQTAPVLNEFINEQLDHYQLPDDKLIVLGFSQGTMMALYTMPRRPKACAGVLGFSGALVGGESLPQEKKSTFPVALFHGDHDMVVPFAALQHAEEGLRKAGFDQVYAHAFPRVGHAIAPEAIEMARDYMKEWFTISDSND